MKDGSNFDYNISDHDSDETCLSEDDESKDIVDPCNDVEF